MEIDTELSPEHKPDFFKNEFTGSARESTQAPGSSEPICLISYEITHILLAGGPQSRRSFWRDYRRELALNKKTNYGNYHVNVCRNHLVSLGMKIDQPVYFRNNRLTTEKTLDASSTKALADPRFN